MSSLARNVARHARKSNLLMAIDRGQAVVLPTQAMPPPQQKAARALIKKTDRQLRKKPCGGCTACCRAFHAGDRPDEQHIAKAKGELCRLCLEGVGCSAYAARPASCVGYNCLWRQCSGMGEELRPDRCGVIFDAGQLNTPVGVVRATLVDALKLEAADEEVGGWLRTLSRAGIPFVHDFAGSFVFSFRATDADAWAQSVLPDGRRATSFYQPIPDAIEETA